MRPASLPPRRIPSLDGLRACSILLVLVAHTVVESTWQPQGWYRAVDHYGSVGVDMFFVLSGFLITGLLLEQRRRGGVQVVHFYIRRAYRIGPAFYVFIAAVAGLGWMGAIPLRGSEVAAAGLLVWNIFPGTSWFLGHTWSLAMEEQFYLLWPAVVQWMDERRLARLAAALILTAPLVRLGCYWLWPQLRRQIPILLPTRVDTLMFGALAALWYERPWLRRGLAACYRMRLPLAGVVFLLVVDPTLRARFGGRFLLPIGWSVEGLSLTLVMLWAIEHAASPVGRALNSRLAVHLGVLSYSLYLWQQLFLASDNHTVTGRFPVNLLCALAAAEASYWGVEQPFLRLRARRRGGQSLRLAAVATAAGGSAGRSR